MQHPDAAPGDGRGVPAGLDAVATRLVAVEGDAGVVDEAGEDADRVGAAADAGDDGVGQASDAARGSGRAPRRRCTRWKSRTISGNGCGPGDGADEVVGVLDVGDPVAHGLVHGVLERAAARRDGNDLGAEQLHPCDVERLATGVLLAHVDHALEAEQRGRRGGGDAVLAGAGLGDDAGLAHAHGEQRLTEHVVDLVRAGVVEVFALEEDPGATCLGRRTGGTRSAGSVGRCRCARSPSSSAWKAGSTMRGAVRGIELVEGDDERLGHEPPAEAAEVAERIGDGRGAARGELRGGHRRLASGRRWARVSRGRS